MRRRLLLTMMVLGWLLAPAAWAAGPATQFTADVISKTVGKPPLKGKVYVDNGRMRMDPSTGPPMKVIIRPDLGKMYMLNTSGSSYREVALPAVQRANAYMPDAVRTPAGTATLNGRKCDKYMVRSGSNSFIFWVQAGTSIPVQMETADKKTHVEYSNVKLGPVPENTFEIPEGFRKVG